MFGDRWIVDRIPTENFPNYTRGNAGEVLADPVSPLGWTYAWESGIVLGCRDGFVEMGVFDLDEYDPNFPESFGLFGGYFYNSLTQARLFGVRSGAGWQAIDNAYFDDPSAVPPYVEKDWHNSPRHTEALGKVMAWFTSTPNVPSIERQKIDAKAVRDSRPDLSAMTTQQLLGRARSIQPHLIPMFASHVKASLGASVGPGILAALTAEIDPTMVGTLLAGIGGVDSAEIANAIWSLSRTVRSSAELTALFDAGLNDLVDRLSGANTAANNAQSASGQPSDSLKFAADVANFLYEYGARGPNEWDLYSESYETRPTLLFSAIDRLRGNDDTADPKAGEARGAATREQKGAELGAMLAGNDEAAQMLAAGLNSARVFMAARERCKTNNIRTLHEIRMCFNELGRRLMADGTLTDARHIYMLTEAELDPFFANPTSSNPLTAVLTERYSEYLALYDLAPPYIVDVTAPPLSAWTRKDAAVVESLAEGDVLKGIAGSPGTATGIAKVLLSVDDPTELDPGDILIAPNTDPAWTPLFLAASAVVVNVGAVGTHAVIVSRELGIPCVPSIADATRRIPNGATITVDGSAGTVTIVALP